MENGDALLRPLVGKAKKKKKKKKKLFCKSAIIIIKVLGNMAHTLHTYWLKLHVKFNVCTCCIK